MNLMNQKCIHIETGIKGLIKNELKGTDKCPDQWGIYWSKGAYQKDIPAHYYWTDKNKIKILQP